MTANELADEAMEHYKAEAPRGFNVNWMKEVATMLRQQTQEIAMLKQIIDANNLQSDIGQFKKELALQKLSDIGQEIESEPVAHRFKWEDKMSWQYGDGYDATGAPNDPDYFTYEPLYTHPTKELDEQFKEGFEAGKEEGWKAHKFHHPTDTIPYKDLHQVVKNVLAQPMRELSDEEILELGNTMPYADRFEFARAILKKASEK